MRNARRHAVRVVVGAVSTTVVSVIPVFLVGGLAVQISAELDLTPFDIGLAVSAYFGVTALTSVPVGRLVEHHGQARASRAAVILSAAGLLAIAVAAQSLWSLIALLIISASANALGQLSSNASLAREIAPSRQGLTFGAKQAAIPLCTLIAGAAVPTVALTVGWRWAFALTAVLALGALVLVPADGADRGSRAAPKRQRATPALIVLGVAAALGAGACNAIGAFLVDSTVAQGVAPGLAGATLTLGSAACVATRLTMGGLSDRHPTGQLWIVMALLAAGGVGMLLLSQASAAALAIGVLLGFGLGWAWPGVLTFAVVKHHPQAPAAATAITQTGVYIGAGAGPLTLGWVATEAGYHTMWPIAGAAMLVACVLVLIAKRHLPELPVIEPSLVPPPVQPAA